jgi:hypothetical protein
MSGRRFRAARWFHVERMARAQLNAGSSGDRESLGRISLAVFQ